MGRIKLPGKEKNKIIILLILIIIAIGIVSYNFLLNNGYMNSNNEKDKQEEIISPINKEDVNINNTNSKNTKKINEDSSKVSDNKAELNKEQKYSAKENELYNEAYSLFFSHQYTNAINKANELIKEFPNNNMGYNIRGIARAYNGEYDNGMKDIDNSLSIDSNYGYARFNKALTYELYGKMDDALEWYNKALDIEDYVWSYYGIASIYGRRGDVKNTMTYLNKAIQMDSGVKETAKAEHDFDPVKNSKEFQAAVYN